MTSLREEVLKILFPRQNGNSDSPMSGISGNGDKDNDNDSDTGATSLKYDEEVQRYQVCKSSERDTACAICLESIGNSQQSVWTGCNHNFHYDCLMKWMMASHDDCPTCRQELWKEDCYQQIALELGRLEAARETSSRSERAQAGNFRTWSSDAAARRRTFEAEYNVACCCFRRLRWRRPGGWLCIFYAINMLLFLAGITYMVVSIAIRL